MDGYLKMINIYLNEVSIQAKEPRCLKPIPQI